MKANIRIEKDSIRILKLHARSMLPKEANRVIRSIIHELGSADGVSGELRDVLSEYPAAAALLLDENELPHGSAQSDAVIDIVRSLVEDIVEAADSHSVRVVFDGFASDRGRGHEMDMQTLLTNLGKTIEILENLFESIDLYEEHETEKRAYHILHTDLTEVQINTEETPYAAMTKDKFELLQKRYRDFHRAVHADYDRKKANSKLKTDYLTIDNYLQDINLFFQHSGIPNDLDCKTAIAIAQDFVLFEITYYEIIDLLRLERVWKM